MKDLLQRIYAFLLAMADSPNNTEEEQEHAESLAEEVTQKIEELESQGSE